MQRARGLGFALALSLGLHLLWATQQAPLWRRPGASAVAAGLPRSALEVRIGPLPLPLLQASGLQGPRSDIAPHEPRRRQPDQATQALPPAPPEGPPPAAPLTSPLTPPSAAAGDHAPRPVYPTQVPASFELEMIARRGPHTGRMHWSWRLDRGRYETRLSGSVHHPTQAGHAIDWSSSGGLDEAGVAPERYVSRPRRGGAQAVNFDRDGPGGVSFSGPTGRHPLVPGAQDRLSWLVQLMAVLQARSTPPRPNEPLVLWVAGPRGDAQDWVFIAQESAQGVHLLRTPQQRYDLRVEVWFDPPPGPVRLRRLRLGHEGSAQPDWEFQALPAPPPHPASAD